jgi:hypothetical protein
MGRLAAGQEAQLLHVQRLFHFQARAQMTIVNRIKSAAVDT